MRTVLSAVLVAGTLIFATGAHAGDRGNRSWSSERNHYDRDNDRRYGDRHGGRYDRDDRRWNDRDRNYRSYRYGYRPYYAPSRHYWRQGARWYYGPVPSGYRGSYYRYPPRDSHGRLIISIPIF